MKVENSAGLSRTSASSRQVITPLPSLVVTSRSLMSNAGSPKNFSAPCASSSIIFLSSTPTVWRDIVPYSLSSPLASSDARNCSTLLKSLKSSSRSPRSSQYLKTMVRTPAWVSFRSSTRDRSKGPKPLTVARSWAPSPPERLTNSTGDPAGVHA